MGGLLPRLARELGEHLPKIKRRRRKPWRRIVPISEIRCPFHERSEWWIVHSREQHGQLFCRFCERTFPPPPGVVVI